MRGAKGAPGGAGTEPRHGAQRGEIRERVEAGSGAAPALLNLWGRGCCGCPPAAVGHPQSSQEHGMWLGCAGETHKWSLVPREAGSQCWALPHHTNFI